MEGLGAGGDVRDRSCLLRCSLRLKARLQNWHLYFLSGASEVFREAGGGDAGVGIAATFAPGILGDVVAVALVESDSTLLELRAPDDADPLCALEMSSHRSVIAETLNGLPERYARALEWKYGDGFSVDEIARMLGLTTIAAQSLLARARVAFKQSWPEEQPP